VNGQGITLVEFDAEVARYLKAQEALGKPVASEDATKAVIEDVTAQLLLAEGAHANGFTLDDAALQARIDALVAQIGGADKLSAWQAEHGYTDQSFRSALRRGAESAWMRDKIIAEVPSTAEQVHVQQILLYNQDTAQSFLTQLNGGADFDELAARADATTRGDLGWVPRGYLLEPAIEAEAFALPVDGYSNVITTDVGFHIVRVLEHDPNRPLSPDALLALQELALKTWIEQQHQQAQIILAPN
jgi:parvulin-like peptidyl-prolyl isomerase